jgi:hypothetical protein
VTTSPWPGPLPEATTVAGALAPGGQSAVARWLGTAVGSRPSAVSTLKEHEGKSAVYRLTDAITASRSVIAKRCLADVAVAECTIQRDVLPALGLRSLEVLAFVPDDDPGFAWIFLEDAGDRSISDTDSGELALAARWLARVHSASAPLAAHTRLPSRQTDFYLDQTRLVRTAIDASITNAVISADDRIVLDRVYVQLQFVAEHWGDVTASCAQLPLSLVHGDFVRKNVRLPSSGEPTSLFVLDWETSGWGMPAIDLARFVGSPVMTDLPTYQRSMCEAGIEISLAQVRELAAAGTVFRLISAMYWASLRLSQPWVDKSISWLRWYNHYMDTALVDLAALKDVSR